MQVLTLRALADNYIFLLLNDPVREVAVVDPGVSAPIIQHLEESGRSLAAILNTHHHADHTGGNRELLKRFLSSSGTSAG